MAIDDEIRDEKLEYDIKIQAVEVSPLSLGKTGKYEYLTGEEILPYIINNNRTSLVYTFFIRKNFWKTKKNDSRAREKTNICYYKSDWKIWAFNQEKW